MSNNYDDGWVTRVRAAGWSEAQIKTAISAIPDSESRERMIALYLEGVHRDDREQAAAILRNRPDQREQAIA